MPKTKTDKKKATKEKPEPIKEKKAADSITHYERGINNITKKVMEK